MSSMVLRLRQAIRSLGRAPGYSAAFVLTLGLALGVNSAVFSMVNGVILKPLPYQNAERILYLKQPAATAGVENVAFSFMEVDDIQEGVSSFEQVVEFGDWDFTVVGEWEPHRAVGGLVTSNYFGTLGLRPELGRLLNPQDDVRGAEPVMVMTHEYWRRMFGSDPGVVGQVVDLAGGMPGQPPVPTRVIGVLAPGLHYTGSRQQDFYVNYSANGHYQDASMRDARNHRMTDVFALLSRDANLEVARSELASVASRLHAEYPDVYDPELGFSMVAVPWHEELTSGARGTFLFLLAASGLILLLAAANITNLTLTRLITKEGDLSTREALGATPRELRLSLMAENLVLGAGGALLALLLAFLSHDSLVAYASRFTVRAQEVGIDWWVLGLTLGAGMAVSALLAWLPGLPVAPGVARVASAESKATGGLQRKRLQRALVVSQLALSFTLLMGAGLLVRSLLAVTAIDPGFATEGVMTVRSPGAPGGLGLPVDGPLFEQVIDEIRAQPGVRSVAAANWVPLEGAVTPTALSVRVNGSAEADARSFLGATNNVSPGYFETLGIPLIAGRYIDQTDAAESRRVVVLNRSAARAHFGDADPIGRQISFGSPGLNQVPGQARPGTVWHEVVGVVEDSREYGMQRDGVHTFYRPAAQNSWGPALVISAQGDSIALAQRVRDAIHAVQPQRAVEPMRSLESLLQAEAAPARLNAVLFGSISLLALLIAAVGVLGALAFSVSQRFREFGIRMAVGAHQGMILTDVLGQGVRMVAVALGIGLVATVLLGRFIAAYLFGVSPLDPASILMAALVLTGVALLAALAPAVRATRIPPAEALRPE